MCVRCRKKEQRRQTLAEHQSSVDEVVGVSHPHLSNNRHADELNSDAASQVRHRTATAAGDAASTQSTPQLNRTLSDCMSRLQLSRQVQQRLPASQFVASEQQY